MGSISIHIQDLREGEGDAAQFIWDRFFPQLKRLAKLKLRGFTDPLADEEDVALNAFASFCRGVEAGRFEALSTRDDIWQILLMLTVRKAVDQRRHSARAKRDGKHRRQTLRDDQLLTVGRQEIAELASGAPTPEFAVMLAEQFHQLLERLEQPVLKQIAVAKLEGFTDEEVAQQLGVARRTIVRKLRLIRDTWDPPSNQTD